MAKPSVGWALWQSKMEYTSEWLRNEQLDMTENDALEPLLSPSPGKLIYYYAQ